MCKYPLCFFMILTLASFYTSIEVETCDSNNTGFFKLLSKTAGRLTSSQTVAFPGRCFKSIEMEIIDFDTKLQVTVRSVGKKSWSCVEFLIVSTGKTTKTHFVALESVSEIVFQKKNSALASSILLIKRDFML